MPSPPITNPSPFTLPSAHAKLNMGSGAGVGVGSGFDAFADMNPFTLKTLDAYRMQLWGKMAAQNHLYQQQQQQQQYQQQQQQQQERERSVSGLVGSLRPAFFKDAATTGFSGSLALSSKVSSLPQSTTNPYPTPPTSPSPAHKTSLSFVGREREIQRDAMYAAIASQTLLGKLGSAFWDAFSGSSSSNSPNTASSSSIPPMKMWDADKVRKVLEGKAVVRVVDIDQLPVLSPVLAAAAASSAGREKGAVVVAKPKVGPKPKGGKQACLEKCPVTELLEESMRSLSLGKK
jgi:bZIP-type transcription factor MBZ1